MRNLKSLFFAAVAAVALTVSAAHAAPSAVTVPVTHANWYVDAQVTQLVVFNNEAQHVVQFAIYDAVGNLTAPYRTTPSLIPGIGYANQFVITAIGGETNEALLGRIKARLQNEVRPHYSSGRRVVDDISVNVRNLPATGAVATPE